MVAKNQSKALRLTVFLLCHASQANAILFFSNRGMPKYTVG
ncbi:MAG TPA: hypothetical protein VMT26_01875 [Candidatus Bathyarchaeia archaeon]|nr:hypothetical protein [Candidatus Bathyarchaeia archaeon]